VHPATARSATDPANALINDAYKLLEVEGRLATLALGLEPTLGVIHADLAARDSFVLDIIEAGRPRVDDYVARLIDEHVFRRADFAETGNGVVRVLAPLSHRIAEAVLPLAAQTLAPVVERVAAMLAEASPYPVDVPTVLTRARHKTASATATRSAKRRDKQAAPVALNVDGVPPRAKRRQRPKVSAEPRLPLPVCVVCGATLPEPADRTSPRRTHCEHCLPERRDEIARNLPAASGDAAARFEESTGHRPSHTVEAQASRAAKNTRRRAEQAAWEAAHKGDRFDPQWFRASVLPALADVTLPAMAAATGLSTSACSKIRAGRRVPHARHWSALAALACVSWPG
jgi:hypothetical protein